MTAYELKNIATLNVKGVGFMCILWGISRDEAVNRLKIQGCYKWILVQIKRLLKQSKKVDLEKRRFRSKLVKMITDADSKFYDYSISHMGIMN